MVGTAALGPLADTQRVPEKVWLVEGLPAHLYVQTDTHWRGQDGKQARQACRGGAPQPPGITAPNPQRELLPETGPCRLNHLLLQLDGFGFVNTVLDVFHEFLWIFSAYFSLCFGFQEADRYGLHQRLP